MAFAIFGGKKWNLRTLYDRVRQMSLTMFQPNAILRSFACTAYANCQPMSNARVSSNSETWEFARTIRSHTHINAMSLCLYVRPNECPNTNGVRMPIKPTVDQHHRKHTCFAHILSWLRCLPRTSFRGNKLWKYVVRMYAKSDVAEKCVCLCDLFVCYGAMKSFLVWWRQR